MLRLITINLHQLAPLEKYFPTKSIIELEPLIFERLEKMMAHLEKEFHSHNPVNIDVRFAALAADVIHNYVYR